MYKINFKSTINSNFFNGLMFERSQFICLLYKFNNKYYYTKRGKKFQKLFNKKNFSDNSLENLMNIFLNRGNKKQLVSRINKAICEFYDIFYNPEDHQEKLIADFEEYPNYHEIQRLLIYNFSWFSFNNLFPILLEEYKIIFDLVKAPKKKIKNPKKVVQWVFKYVPYDSRLKYILPLVKTYISMESSNVLEERFYSFFTSLAILGKNASLLNRKNNIYSKLLKSKNKSI